MTNYQAFAQRIEQSLDCEKLQQSLTRCWDNGLFTVSEFMRLDDKILNKQFKEDKHHD